MTFKDALSIYNKENRITASAEFDQKCQQLYTIINTSTSQYKTILMAGRSGAGKTSIINAVSRILTDNRNMNFSLNWIDLDSTPSLLVLGGNYQNNRIQGLIPIFIEVAVNNMKPNELQEYQYSNLIQHW